MLHTSPPVLSSNGLLLNIQFSEHYKMTLNFKTRDAARKFANKRNAIGIKTSVKDNGKEATKAGGKRFVVCVDKRLSFVK